MSISTNKHIPILDGIRAYAVLMVCVVHFFQVDELALYESNKYLGIILFKISQLGLRGVELFFLLSGFLITGILVNSKSSKNYFSTFYLRRFIRIFPLYYFVLAFSFFIMPIFFDIDEAGQTVIKNQWWLWSYMQNLSHIFSDFSWDSSTNFFSFGHFWSLSVEEHFYLFWPFLIFYTRKDLLSQIMWTIVGFSLFTILFSYFFNEAFPLLSWSTLRGAGILSLGGLISIYRNRPLVWIRVSSFANKLILPFGILFVIVNFIPRRYDFQLISSEISSVLFFSSLIVVSLNKNKFADKLFNHNWLYFIGKISYGIYVYHGMLRPFFKIYVYENLNIFIHDGIMASLIYTFICILLSIALAWISWIVIESPILQLKKYFKY